MCGIAGVWSCRTHHEDELGATAARMASSLVHRGPDDSGLFVDSANGVAFGFRRLSIIDLSPAGHQPMRSATGRYSIVFNGEVYNFEAVRAELEHAGLAPSWRGHSDTEVLLAAVEAWGVAAAVTRFTGMFAIALWDSLERKMHLVRDRMGVKPLYYAFTRDGLVFGSELKALVASGSIDRDIDRDALALYVRYTYVPAPFTIYRGVSKLQPGTILTLDAPESKPAPRPYWSVAEVATQGLGNRYSDSAEEDAIAETHALALDAIKLRMISDVPLGVFLSGGIDSSLVAALMQAQTTSRVRTFSIGFREAEYDESGFAAAIARHLGTDHTELFATPREAMEIIPRLPQMYDEPFGDSSQIPTHLVSLLARRFVTVALSGDGGDELFGGYNRYFVGQDFWRRAQNVPWPVRSLVGASMRMVPAPAWNALLAPDRGIAPRRFRRERAGERIHKLGRALGGNGPDELYFEVVSHWRSLVVGGQEPSIALLRREEWPPITDHVERMMFFDQISYLPDDILAKVDRASMAASLESREPLLDHRLVELSWRLPLSMKIRDGRGKWILRMLLAKYVPTALTDRPKQGFGLPVDHWLRGPLREWAEGLIDGRRLDREGFFHRQLIAERWKQHLGGGHNWQLYLWPLLMFQAWLDAQAEQQSGEVEMPRVVTPGRAQA